MISIYVIYKVHSDDDGSLELKARIASHGNNCRDKFSLITDFAQCPTTGIRILCSIASIMTWSIANIYFTGAYLQIADAKRDRHVIPLRLTLHWHLLTSAYGLVNANAK